ncbi:hypothetical protein [Microbacterium sp.]|uniref:hypothetical protein n=1 Tax=Microbacterium sp. TaxID=51671 RepID=UPI003C1F9C81
MTEARENFRLLYAFGSGINPMMVTFGGSPDDSARNTIADALSKAGRAADGDASDLKLSMSWAMTLTPGTRNS